MKTKNILDIFRFASTLSLASKTKPLYILAKKLDNSYLYCSAFNIYLVSGTSDIIVLYAYSRDKPNKYVRYVDAPNEKYELTSNMHNPIGLYLPIIYVVNLPKVIDPILNKIELEVVSNSAVSLNNEIDLSELGEMLDIIVLEFEDLVRFVLERKETKSLLFTVQSGKNAIYFSFGEPWRVNNKLYGKVILSEGPITNRSFVAISENGEVIWSDGRRDPTLAYASIIHVDELSSNFREILVSFTNPY